jgi:hypothetical protein
MKDRIKLIVDDGRWPLFFTSVEEAESYLEAIDVDNGEYPRAWGPEGEPYRLTSVDGGVVVVEDESESKCRTELEGFLRRYLGDKAAESDDLRALLNKCEPSIVY